jgi:BirA family biotin operon repressor/biotin-[acetyl-CoA-carboxylase] ligase
MELADDLDPDELGRLLPDRAVRSYPAVLSTEADALAWARAGAAAGSVVVADYQASPRGRAGLEWQVEQGIGLGFSLVVRPDLVSAREGWLYTVATTALADVIAATGASEVTSEWPDEALASGERAAAVGVTTELGGATMAWAVLNVLVTDAPLPRGPLLARLVEAIEARLGQAASEVLDDQRRRCSTLGRTVRARLIPMGPSGVQIEGRADGLLADGALVIETPRGARVAVLPHHLGVLDHIDNPDGRPPSE